MGTENDTLVQYGKSFQLKVVAALFIDKKFLRQLSEYLDIEYFDSDSVKWIVEHTIKYFLDYSECPTLEVMKVKLSDVKNEVLRLTIIDTLKDVYKYADATDLDFVKEETITFCKNQEIKKAILDSVDLLKLGRYDEIKRKIDLSMRVGMDNEIGHDYNLGVTTRLKETARKVIATPWEPINDLTEGGFAPGELIIFAAPPGVGKSMSLVNIAAHAVKAGKNVIYYTLELNEFYVGRRFDSYYTEIPSSNLKHHEIEVETAINKLSGKLLIKYYPTKTASVQTIVSHIDKCKLTGFIPDIIIVDYADLLRFNTNGNQRDDLALGTVYEDLRGLAGVLQIPIYSASQTSRVSVEQDIIKADTISASFSKIMIADFVISLSRKTTDKIAGTGRWHIIKNRFGPDGLTFMSRLNMAISKIDIYDGDSIESKHVTRDSNTESITKSYLKNKFEDMREGLI